MKKLQTIGLNQIHIDDPFWNRYTRSVTEKIIPYQWRVLNDQEPEAEPSHCIRNFRRAAGEEEGGFYGFVFQDTDLAKWLEAVACSLSSTSDPALEAQADQVIDLVGRAQQPDGYLDTYFILEAPESKWRNLQQGHELYTAGHMMEAAAAYYQVTGKDKLLRIMCRCADLICDTFRQPEFAQSIPGHEEVEIGLFKLYQVTGERRYLDMARDFVDRRGQQPDIFVREREHPRWISIFADMDPTNTRYHQCHKPVRQQDTAEGHAVRAVYLYCAMADIAGEDGDRELLAACERLYENITQKRMYLTGGIGSSGYMERFTTDYDLPTASGYAESCASIGLALFCRRMAQITREGRYVDTMEQALMNTVLAGISLDGARFFYVNPLEVWPDNCLESTSMSHVKPVRQRWFGCACCPPNIARTLASLGEYVCFTDENSLWLNLFVSGQIHAQLGGVPVEVTVETRFPNQGTVKLHLRPQRPAEGMLALRLPGYVQDYTLTENGAPVSARLEQGYLCLERLWEETTLVYEMDIPPRFVYANPRLRGYAGKVAVVKGPLVYCLEQADNGENLAGVYLDTGAGLTETFQPELLGGVTVLHARGKRLTDDGEGALYRRTPARMAEAELTLVPYHCWNNRAPGEMTVWVNRIP
ncbi:MAG: glycoside hydrolase family 127 protein [Clostridiales bacterium]|nr:glycoside hydrolase family 127 protein [Clostridiales bacterium]